MSSYGGEEMANERDPSGAEISVGDIAPRAQVTLCVRHTELPADPSLLNTHAAEYHLCTKRALRFTPRPACLQRGPAPWEGGTDAWQGALTVLEDPLHIQPVRGACLVVGTPLQVAGELPRPGVVDDPWVSGTYGICNG